MMPSSMTMQLLSGAPQLRLQVRDAGQVGECRRAAQRLAQTCDFDDTAAGRVALLATELATNLVRHAGGGELLLQALGQDAGTRIELLAIDRGPGMADVQQCLRDGYSTAGGMGAGLGAVARLSNTFDIYSIAGQGTVVLSRVAPGAPERGAGAGAGAGAAPAELELGAICVAMTGESACGDTWSVAQEGGNVAILVADGLGHGPLAASAALAASGAFAQQPFEAPAEAMQRLHRAIAGTRGAAAACARLDGGADRLEYAGVGNISGFLVSPQRSHGMVSHNGTLGTNLLRAQQFGYDWPRDCRLVMHSDGLSARWSLSAYEGLYAHHPAVLAAVLYRDHGRGRDDATVLVLSRRA